MRARPGRKLTRVGWFLIAIALATGQIPLAEGQAPAPGSPTIRGPFVSASVTPALSLDLRRLPTEVPWQPGDPVREVNPRQGGDRALDETDGVQTGDPLFGDHPGLSLFRARRQILLNFDGIPFTGAVPPDTIGDVGPNHYVQAVNVQFAVFSKTGALLAGPVDINSLWAGTGTQCAANNDGDPIVLYDRQADRWLLAQFAVPGGPSGFHICIAISLTPDPTGAFYVYDFPVPEFPDYFKVGVWPDGYYVSTNEGPPNVGVYAFNRAAMLAGAPGNFIRFTLANENFLLPSDLDGATPPPAGAPNHFYTFNDNAFFGAGPHRIEVYDFHADFATPASSTFTLAATVPITPFNYTVCGFFVLECIPQPGTARRLDAVSEWPMWRAQYRNFGTHETIVSNFTVDVNTTNLAGIRWFELRKTGGGNWTLFQEGTHAPDANHRFMGSAAMDGSGNIALGYSVSSSTVFPSIGVAARRATDPLGTLGGETAIIIGGGSQTGFNRWGDYSSMNVDPADDCTFWYTNEYYQASAPANWRTRIASFTIPGCGGQPPAFALTLTLNQRSYGSGSPLDIDLTVANPGPLLIVDVYFGALLPASVGPALGCPLGDAVAFFANGLTALIVACASAPIQSLPRTVAGVPIPAGLPATTVQDFFSFVWPPSAPAGVYAFFMLLTQANGFLDGIINPGDVIQLATDTATFTP